jgi:hypothetical protein
MDGNVRGDPVSDQGSVHTRGFSKFEYFGHIGISQQEFAGTDKLTVIKCGEIANICSRLTYAGVHVMSCGIKILVRSTYQVASQNQIKTSAKVSILS